MLIGTKMALHKAVAKYQKKTYRVVTVRIRKEKAERWIEKLHQDGKTQNGFVNQKIDEYLEEP
jgi:hypothetical protein